MLGHGTHIVGRAPGAAARCDDAAIEPHHLLIEISADGCRGAPVDRTGARARRRTSPSAIRLRSWQRHASRSVTACSTCARAIHSTWSRRQSGQHHRDGRRVCRDSLPAFRRRLGSRLACPALAGAVRASETSGGLLPAVLALAGSGVGGGAVAPADVPVFGALGAFVAFGTWGGQRITRVPSRVGARRGAPRTRRRSSTGAVESQRAGFVAHHLPNDSTPASARSAIEGLTADLWSRAGGTCRWVRRVCRARERRLDAASGRCRRQRDDREVTSAMSMLTDLPLAADVGAACRLAIRGDARSGSVEPPVRSCCSSPPTADRPMCAFVVVTARAAPLALARAAATRHHSGRSSSRWSPKSELARHRSPSTTSRRTLIS